MHMILLVCLAALPRAECDPNTALRTAIGPEVELHECRRWAASWEADPEVRPLVGEGRYLKILCDYRARLVG